MNKFNSYEYMKEYNKAHYQKYAINLKKNDPEQIEIIKRLKIASIHLNKSASEIALNAISEYLSKNGF